MKLKKGKKVYWVDPDPTSNCSQYGIIIDIQKPITKDSVITLKTIAGGELEAYVHELRSRKPR